MKNLDKNIFTAILAITILIGTSGFEVYKHFCVSHNYSGISMLETPLCEKSHTQVTETDDCCKIEEVEQTDCCESENTANSYPVNITSDEVDCCSSVVDSKRIYENIYPPLDKKNFSVELIALITLIDHELDHKTAKHSLTNNLDLPPPISGKDLLYTIHQLKLDTPHC